MTFKAAGYGCLFLCKIRLQPGSAAQKKIKKMLPVLFRKLLFLRIMLFLAITINHYPAGVFFYEKKL